MKTFRSFCGWFVVWFFFVLVPVSLITSSIEEIRPMMKINVDAKKYCETLNVLGIIK